MKKILLLTVGLLSAMLLPAQGVYQLWGMTRGDGTNNMGVVFNTDGTGDNLQIKRKLKNSYPGGNPVYTNLIEHNNKFYGMTSEGGDNNLGVIFEWDPSTNVYIKKVDFNGIDGANPTGSLTFYAGKFYGMTSLGGNNNQGVIFEWNPSTNTLLKKNDLNVGAGSTPLGSMTLYLDKFYGVTNKGGNYNGGVIFEWRPSTNVFIKKFDFDFTKGSYPIGDLTLYRGRFYGMTSEGGGTGKGVIFEWNPVTNIFYKKKDFNGLDGSNPHGGLTMLNGDFYGTANEGGINNKGVIFKWNPLTNAYSKRFDLTKIQGANPEGNLVFYGEKFYGMTPIGGINPGDPEDAPHGQIFEWNPVTNAFWGVLDFSPYLTGSSPHGSLSIYEGKLYGMTSWGGSNCATCDNRNGVIFDIEPSSEIYTKRISFNSTDGIGTGSLTQYKGKIYGITEEGGKDDVGTIAEWDLSTNRYTKKIDLPFSSYSCSYLTLFNSKFYGMSWIGDNNIGAIFEWDPATNVYLKKFDFQFDFFVRPSGSLVLSNGKFYGRLSSTWSNETVVVFEWDPVTNVCIYKISFNGANTDVPQNGLTRFNEKFYGTTNGNDNNSAGGLFEWDPLTNDYLKKFDFVNATNERSPFGSLTFCAGKLYGFAEGGAVGDGVIFEWDPVTNEYAKKFDFNGRIDGWPQGNLAMNAGKLYGFATNRNDSAVIFEWDPASNIYTRKSNFILANTGIPSVTNLTLAPAPVAKGLSGSCTAFPSVTINSSNNNQWVAITDEEGNAVAEIKANGNNLGIVTAAIFINNTSVREDANKKLYLDRSITITPQFQPATAVDIRLYIKGSEYTALKNAVNSIGQTSGIDSINDIRIYKVNSGCLPAVSTLTNLVTTVAGTWENDYVLSATITSFSSFYFAGKAAVCSAPVITQVHANPSTLWPPNHQFKNVTVNYTVTGNCPPYSSWLTVSSNEPSAGTGCGDAAPDWIIVNNHHLKLRAERAGRGNGRVYTITVNTKNAAGNIAAKKTTVTVPHHQGYSHSKGNYTDGYIDANGDYFDHWFDCTITPNPSSQSFNLQVATASSEKIEATLLDLSGRLIRKMNTEKNQSIRFGDELKPGVYIVIITQGQQQQIFKVVKQ